MSTIFDRFESKIVMFVKSSLHGPRVCTFTIAIRERHKPLAYNVGNTKSEYAFEHALRTRNITLRHGNGIESDSASIGLEHICFVQHADASTKQCVQNNPGRSLDNTLYVVSIPCRAVCPICVSMVDRDCAPPV